MLRPVQETMPKVNTAVSSLKSGNNKHGFTSVQLPPESLPIVRSGLGVLTRQWLKKEII